MNHEGCYVMTFLVPQTIGTSRLQLRMFTDADWEPEIAPELTGHGLPLSKCEAYNRVYDQPLESR
jgi:hypothetical protein